MGFMQYVLGVALVDGRQWRPGGHLALRVRGSAASSPGRAYRGPGLPRQLPRHGSERTVSLEGPALEYSTSLKGSFYAEGSKSTYMKRPLPLWSHCGGP
ncbi:hypothetical protein NDU88_003281 [Pleurodeles waltl]|uniref:Uncharacterized protein n=1 Tax=Pleurodeles waltl TaxID=8319 RepID=A0AAV7MDF0_PLEWA|nr:hypothetical protein NDU88_003281 [Pleurodeles waltl]